LLYSIYFSKSAKRIQNDELYFSTKDQNIQNDPNRCEEGQRLNESKSTTG
jgi:hypothetical protein